MAQGCLCYRSMRSCVQISSTQASGLVCLHMPVISALGIGAGQEDRQKGWVPWPANLALARESQGVRQRATKEDTWYCLVSTQAHSEPPPSQQQQRNRRVLLLVFFLSSNDHIFICLLSFEARGVRRGERKKVWNERRRGFTFLRAFGTACCCRTAWLDLKSTSLCGPRENCFLTLSLDTVVKGKFKNNTNINCRFIFSFTQRYKQGWSNRPIIKYSWEEENKVRNLQSVVIHA